MQRREEPGVVQGEQDQGIPDVRVADGDQASGPSVNDLQADIHDVYVPSYDAPGGAVRDVDEGSPGAQFLQDRLERCDICGQLKPDVRSRECGSCYDTEDALRLRREDARWAHLDKVRW